MTDARMRQGEALYKPLCDNGVLYRHFIRHPQALEVLAIRPGLLLLLRLLVPYRILDPV